MTYRPLGRTGMHVSRLALGAMMLGRYGNRDHEACVALVHRALDAGINLIDTADVYSNGESEQILAKALAGGLRDNVILATKCYFPVLAGPLEERPRPNTYGLSRRHVIRACEDSLRRLGTDRIDLYQVHRPDAQTDLDETLGALSDLVQQGKVHAIGTSTFPAESLVEAQWVSERRGRERFSTEQAPYSLFSRRIERDVLPVCQRYGIGALVWSPLGAGWLSGRHRTGASSEGTRRARLLPDQFDPADPANQRKRELVEELVVMADELGLSLPRFALAWTLEHPVVTSTIIGPRTMEQLDGLLGAEELRLPVETLDRLDQLIPPGTSVREADDRAEVPWLTDASQRRQAR